MIKELIFLFASVEYDTALETRHVIEALQPNLSVEQVIDLTLAVEKYSRKYDLPRDKFVAILFQESSLYLDPTGCLQNKSRCRPDYGVGQVNYRVWGSKLKMDKERTLTDADYSVKLSAKIMNHYKVKYSKRDRDWIYRYHSNTPRFKTLYKERVKAVYDTIKTELEGFSNDQRQRNYNIRAYCDHSEGQKEIPSRLFKSSVYN